MNKNISMPAAGFDMALILNVGGHEYKLDGSFAGSKFSLLYSKPMKDKDVIDLGSTKDALIAIGNTFGEGEGEKFYKEVENVISRMPSLFRNVFTGFLTAHLIIIKMEIVIESGKPTQYAFCFGLLFKEKVSIAGIVLEYFTFEYDGMSKVKPAVKSSKPALISA